MAVQRPTTCMGAGSAAGAASIIIFASVGLAEPVGAESSVTLIDQTQDPFRVTLGPASDGSVHANEIATMALVASNQQVGTLGLYNSGGHVDVQVNGGLHDLGTRPDGSARILGEWREFSGAGEHVRRVQAIWATDDGSALLPFGTMVGGHQAQFLTWKLGIEDMIEWRPAIDEVELTRATFFGSFDGGATFPAQVNIIQLFQSGLSQWDLAGAYDVGTDLVSDTSGPSGFNYVMTEYTFTAVPAPAALSVLAGAGLAFGVRRRR